MSNHNPCISFYLFLFFLVFRNRTKNINATEISEDIYKAEKAQNKANDDLERSSRDRDTSRRRVQDVKMSNIRVLSSACLLSACGNMFLLSRFRLKKN